MVKVKSGSKPLSSNLDSAHNMCNRNCATWIQLLSTLLHQHNIDSQLRELREMPNDLSVNTKK